MGAHPARGDQLVVRERHRRAVHAEVPRQLAGRGQLHARRQHALLDQPLEVSLDLARERDRLRPVDRDVHHLPHPAIFDGFVRM